MVRVGESLGNPIELPYVADGIQLRGRAIFVLPYFSHEEGEWYDFLDVPRRGLMRVAIRGVAGGAYLASERLSADEDLYLPLEELVFQRMSLPSLARQLSGLEDVVENFASLLELYELVSQNCHEKRAGARETAQLLVNQLVVLARTAFDVLQGICRQACATTRRLDDQSKPLMKPFPRKDSFADIALDSGAPRSREALMAAYDMPEAIAEFYNGHAAFLMNIRSIRDSIVHRGHNAGFVYDLERGLAVATDRRPWSELGIWEDAWLERNALGSLRALFAYVTLHAMTATTAFAEAFSTCIALPEPMSPANHVFLRGPLNHHLLGLSETLASPWERQPKTGENQ
jgi:hypothetical protein